MSFDSVPLSYAVTAKREMEEAERKRFAKKCVREFLQYCSTETPYLLVDPGTKKLCTDFEPDIAGEGYVEKSRLTVEQICDGIDAGHNVALKAGVASGWFALDFDHDEQDLKRPTQDMLAFLELLGSRLDDCFIIQSGRGPRRHIYVRCMESEYVSAQRLKASIPHYHSSSAVIGFPHGNSRMEAKAGHEFITFMGSLHELGGVYWPLLWPKRTRLTSWPWPIPSQEEVDRIIPKGKHERYWAEKLDQTCEAIGHMRDGQGRGKAIQNALRKYADAVRQGFLPWDIMHARIYRAAAKCGKYQEDSDYWDGQFKRTKADIDSGRPTLEDVPGKICGISIAPGETPEATVVAMNKLYEADPECLFQLAGDFVTVEHEDARVPPDFHRKKPEEVGEKEAARQEQFNQDVAEVNPGSVPVRHRIRKKKTIPYFTFLLGARFAWSKFERGKPKVIDCPKEVASQFLSLAGTERCPFKDIGRVLSFPVLRDDGSVWRGERKENGELFRRFDPITGIYFDPTGARLPTFPDLWEEDSPNWTSRRAIMKEYVFLRRMICREFQFASAETGADSFMLALLTVLSRHLYDTAPLFAFTSNAPGAGKTRLLDVISLIACNAIAETHHYPQTEEKFDKKLTAALRGSSPLIGWDDVNCFKRGPVADEYLNQFLTQSARSYIKYYGQDLEGLNVQVTNVMTGVGLEFSGHMHRRAVLLDIVGQGFRKGGFRPLKKLALQHRERLIAAGLHVLGGYIRSGLPLPDLWKNDTEAELGSFENWSKIVRSAVVWITGVDPCLATYEAAEEDVEGEQICLFLRWLYQYGANEGLTGKEIATYVTSYYERRQAVMREISTQGLMSGRNMLTEGMEAACELFEGALRVSGLTGRKLSNQIRIWKGVEFGPFLLRKDDSRRVSRWIVSYDGDKEHAKERYGGKDIVMQIEEPQKSEESSESDSGVAQNEGESMRWPSEGYSP